MFTCQSFGSNTVLLVYYSPGSIPPRVNHEGADRNQTLLAIRWKERTLKSLKTAFLTTRLLASRRKAMTVQKSLLVPGSLLIQCRLPCKQRIRRIQAGSLTVFTNRLDSHLPQSLRSLPLLMIKVQTARIIIFDKDDTCATPLQE